MEDLSKEQSKVITPILISYTPYSTHSLILLDLKTNQIVGNKTLTHTWKFLDLLSFFNDQITLDVLTPDTIIHCIKQNPFTTKGFAALLASNKLELSYYNRSEILPSVNCTRILFQQYLNPQKLHLLPEFIAQWNTKVAPNLNSITASQTESLDGK